MSALAPALQAYFTGRLNSQRAASPNTIATDKHASRLLLAFAARRTDATPSHWDSNAAAAARTSSAARRSLAASVHRPELIHRSTALWTTVPSVLPPVKVH